MCKLLRGVIIDNDYKADRTIKENVRCRYFFLIISNVKKKSNSTIGKPVVTLSARVSMNTY